MSRDTTEGVLSLGGMAVAFIGFLMWWAAQWMINTDMENFRDRQSPHNKEWIKQYSAEGGKR